jgi:hypothetical protein
VGGGAWLPPSLRSGGSERSPAPRPAPPSSTFASPRAPIIHVRITSAPIISVRITRELRKWMGQLEVTAFASKSGACGSATCHVHTETPTGISVCIRGALTTA